MNQEKKERLVRDFEAWWNHELKRPIFQVTLSKTDKQPCATRGQLLDMLYNFDLDPKEVAREYRQSFENNLYLGDAFPVFYMRSTGVLGAMLGQTYSIDVKRGTIWFEEMKDLELDEIHPVLKDDDKIYQRGLALIDAFQDEFKDDIALGIPNLGGIMDIVESMRGANNSLIDLYDDPEEVLRLNEDILEAFKKAYHGNMNRIDLDKVLGYTGWITLLSQKPYFISQCDFCCMIGKPHFEEFIYPILKEEAALVERPFYHLDGPGAIKHLDKILECGFVGIQWVPGAGAKPHADSSWDEIYKKIYDAGLLMQINLDNGKSDLPAIDHIYEVLGDISHCAFQISGSEEDRELFETYLSKYGVPH